MSIKIKKRRRDIVDSFFLLIILSLFFIPLVFAGTGFTGDTSLEYAGTSTSPNEYYKDVAGTNSVDVGIELCGVGIRYVGAAYAIKEGSTWHYALITKGSTAALGYANQVSGSCYVTDPSDILVSPSHYGTTPEVFRAAFPGNPWIVYSTTENPATLTNFVFPTPNDATLLGSYSFSMAFDQSTGKVTVQIPTISFTGSASVSKQANAGDNFGVSSDNKMVIGLCNDEYGASCSDAEVISSFNSAKSYDSNIALIDDEHIYTRYLVINGMGTQTCIGSNLQISSSDISVSQDPIYYSQDLNITYTIQNPRDTPYERYGGNVDIDDTFYVNVSIYEKNNTSNVIYTNISEITNNITVDGTLSEIIPWTANARSGDYTIKVTLDSNSDITECDESDNSATKDFELKPVTTPTIMIDGVERDSFPIANVPYNLSFHFVNSDDLTLNNASVVLTERNGLSLAAPTQVFNITTNGTTNTTEKSGTISETNIYLTTDYSGNSTMVFIPTYNKLYSAQYNYSNLDEYIGNYSLNFTGTQSDGENFIFIDSNKETSLSYSLSIVNTSYTGDYIHKTLINENVVSQSLDFIYQTFANFLDTITN